MEAAPGSPDMDAEGLFLTAVPEKQLQAAQERALQGIFGPVQRLRSAEQPGEQRRLPSIVRDRVRELCQKGLDFCSRSQWEEAIACYSKAIALDPHRAELYGQRAEAFVQLCDFQSATLNWRKALALAPAHGQRGLRRLALLLHLQGRCLLDQELFCEALEAFTRAAELRPGCRALRRGSIACLAALNKFPECLQTLDRDVEEDAGNPDLYVLRASFHERFGRLALCHQDLARALVLEPQHGAALALKQRLRRRGREAKAEAVTKALSGDLQGALLKISFAIESDPLAADLLILRGTLLRRLQSFRAAREDLARARALAAQGSPEARDVQRQLVLTHNDCAVRCYALGLYEDAVALLGEALRDEKHEEGLYVNRGDCFLRLGALPLALADYEQALELRPAERGVRQRLALALHEQGQRELAARRYLQAEARFSAALDYEPCKAQYYLGRARSRLGQGKVRSAKEDVVLSLWLDPADSEVLALVRYLFPGKTVRAVLRSASGRLAKETLDKVLQRPAGLPALAGVTHGSGRRRPPVPPEDDAEEAAEPVDAQGGWWGGGSSIRRCTSARELCEELAARGATAASVPLLEAALPRSQTDPKPVGPEQQEDV